MTDETKKDEPISEIEEVKKQLEEAKAKCEEYLNGWKRERADFLNYKKGEMERIGDLAKYANEEIILNILPVLDNLLLAQMHISDNGLAQVIKQFQDLLKKEGIEPIKTIGEQFNPNVMEAVEELTVEEKEPNIVVEEAQRGYTMNGKIIRVARVKVTK